MLSIEGYIARRKKEDGLNEFDRNARTRNIKRCIDYIFEYYENYLNTPEADERTVLHEKRVEKYRAQLHEYDPEVRAWIVDIYRQHGRYMHRQIGNVLINDIFFLLYNTDSEFRSASYHCYSKLVKKLPFLQGQTEMLYRFIRDHHRVESERFLSSMPSICEELDGWLDNAWVGHQVSMHAFAQNWIFMFSDDVASWPVTHRKQSSDAWRKYEYDYRQKNNLFNLDSLYRKVPKKAFIEGKKQLLEILFMYYWIHDIEGDEDYWQEYLNEVLPALKKSKG